MRRRFFFAASIPLRIAEGTSFALPTPNPTTRAEESPTTTRAEKLMFLPPLTTLVTRLIATTFSFRFNDCGSTRFTTVVAITTPPPLPAPHRRALSPGHGRYSRPGQTRLW